MLLNLTDGPIEGSGVETVTVSNVSGGWCGSCFRERRARMFAGGGGSSCVLPDAVDVVEVKRSRLGGNVKSGGAAQ